MLGIAMLNEKQQPTAEHRGFRFRATDSVGVTHNSSAADATAGF